MCPVRTVAISNSASSIGISLILGPGIIRWCDEKTRSLSSREKSSPKPYATFNEKMRQASSMPLGSILVVAFFGPGWLLLFWEDQKEQKKDVSQ